MAFVINKSQQKSIFTSKNLNPGPGAYQFQAHNTQYNPAPFNASASKRSCFQTTQSNLGPGSYSKTSIKECFKPNTTFVTSFKSKAARFPYQQNKKSRMATQPEEESRQNLFLQNKSCQLISTQEQFLQKKLNSKRQFLKQLRKKNQQRKINSIVNLQKGKVRILLSNPRNTENIQSFYINDYIQLKQAQGPGEYNVNNKNGSQNKSVIDWSKDKQKRFKKSKSMTNASPGPGQYQSVQKQKSSLSKKPSSSFSYGGVRTFMDTIIYKTSNQLKAQIMQQKGIVEYQPGPADYSPQKQSKDSYYYGKQIMSSSIQRFIIDKNKNSFPGPGYYVNIDSKSKYSAVVKQMRQKIFGKNGSLIKQQKDDFVTLEKQLKNIQPQKLSYQDQVLCTIKERCQSKAGTISQQPRFKEFHQNKQPGPGQYYSLFEVKNPPDVSAIFKSNTQRQPFQINKENSSTQFYQIGINDIAVKTQKIKNDLNNLKKVAIQKPAFDSSVARFNSIMAENSQQQKNMKSNRPQPQKRDQIDYQIFKLLKPNSNCASVFRSTTTRTPLEIKNNPGPGSYQKPDLLNKISFNIQYDKSKINKAV